MQLVTLATKHHAERARAARRDAQGRGDRGEPAADAARLEAALDGPNAVPAAEARLHAWLLAVDAALAGKAVAVPWAIVAIYLKQVLCVRLVGPASEDVDRLDHAADVLIAALSEFLQDVGSRAIPPETYHIM